MCDYDSLKDNLWKGILSSLPSLNIQLALCELPSDLRGSHAAHVPASRLCQEYKWSTLLVYLDARPPSRDWAQIASMLPRIHPKAVSASRRTHRRSRILGPATQRGKKHAVPSPVSKRLLRNLPPRASHFTQRRALVPSSLASKFIPLGETRLQFVFLILKHLFGRQTSVFCQHTLINCVFVFSCWPMYFSWFNYFKEDSMRLKRLLSLTVTVRVDTFYSKWHFPFHVCPSLKEQANGTAQLFKASQGCQIPKRMLCPIEWRGTAPLTRNRQFLMLTAAQYSQVNGCIPQIMFLFWFHSSHILLRGAQRAVCCYRMPLVLPRTIRTHRVWQALTECKNKRSHLRFLSLSHQQGKGLPTTAPATKSTWILWCLKCYQAEYNISLHSSAPGNYSSINLFVCARPSSHLHTANKQGGCAWWTCTGMPPGEGADSSANPLVQRVLLPSSEAIILRWQHFLTRFLSCSSFLCYK